MNTNELALFTDSVNKLIEGQLILVDKHIASVLKCVATSPILYKNLGVTLKTMSYSTEFSRARVTWTKSDGVVESRLKLPVDRNRLFAFVVCLLTEVDSGRRNFLDFLKEYYNDSDSNAAYLKFANEVLKPFKRAGENILHTIDPESLNREFFEQAEKFFVAEKIYIDTSVLNGIFDLMEEIRLTIAEQNLSEPFRIEYANVSEYLVNALYYKNPKVLKICWIAYKNTLSGYQAVLPTLRRLAETIGGLIF